MGYIVFWWNKKPKEAEGPLTKEESESFWKSQRFVDHPTKPQVKVRNEHGDLEAQFVETLSEEFADLPVLPYSE